jgi:hypothetical protein
MAPCECEDCTRAVRGPVIENQLLIGRTSTVFWDHRLRGIVRLRCSCGKRVDDEYHYHQHLAELVVNLGLSHHWFDEAKLDLSRSSR